MGLSVATDPDDNALYETANAENELYETCKDEDSEGEKEAEASGDVEKKVEWQAWLTIIHLSPIHINHFSFELYQGFID